MGTPRLAGFVWPGMVLAGLALGVAVLAAWPEPTERVVRLPYGEALPKTALAAPAPREAAQPAEVEQAAVVPASVEEPRSPAAIVQPEEEEAGRVLAAVEPAPATPAAPAPAAPAATEPATASTPPARSWGPAPVPSVLDGLEGYEPESPEQLGAEPLPGFGVTPPAPPAAG